MPRALTASRPAPPPRERTAGAKAGRFALPGHTMQRGDFGTVTAVLPTCELAHRPRHRCAWHVPGRAAPLLRAAPVRERGGTRCHAGAGVGRAAARVAAGIPAQPSVSGLAALRLGGLAGPVTGGVYRLFGWARRAPAPPAYRRCVPRLGQLQLLLEAVGAHQVPRADQQERDAETPVVEVEDRQAVEGEGDAEEEPLAEPRQARAISARPKSARASDRRPTRRGPPLAP